MIYELPSTIAEVATKYRLKSEHVEQAAAVSAHVYERNEIGGKTKVVSNEKAFVAEVRALRGKPMWKR
jgi:hypothetical protein